MDFPILINIGIFVIPTTHKKKKASENSEAFFLYLQPIYIKISKRNEVKESAYIDNHMYSYNFQY